MSFPQNINVQVTQTYTSGPDGAGPWARRHARQQRHRRALPQHGEAAGNADDAAPLRRARRLLRDGDLRLRPRREQGRRARLHPAAPAREEGSGRGRVRARAADRVLRRSRDAGPVRARGSRRPSRTGSRRSRRRASGTASSRRTRHRRARIRTGIRRTCATRSSGGCRRPIENAQRPEHPRSAQRRDSRRRHPALPQRPEPGVDVVLRAGRAARSAREGRCRCPTS